MNNSFYFCIFYPQSYFIVSELMTSHNLYYIYMIYYVGDDAS